MGNTQKIKLEELQKDECSKFLCKFQHFEDDILLGYSDQFIEFLKSNLEKKVKIVTFIGTSGAGKSTILNMILHDFQGNLKQFFKSSNSKSQVTSGIDFYILMDENNREIKTIYLDCQGFQGVTKSTTQNEEEEVDLKKDLEDQLKLEQKLTLLISLICGLSTCVFYVTKEENREQQSLDRLLKYHNMYKKDGKCGQISNFVNIINQFNKSPSQLSNDSNVQFSKTFYLQQFNEYTEIQAYIAVTKTFQQQQLTVNNQNNSYYTLPKTYLETIKEIKNYIEQSKYISNDSWKKSQISELTCQIILDMIQTAFGTINEGLNDCPQNFIDVLALSHQKKEEFRQKLEKIKLEIQNNNDDNLLKLKQEIGNFSGQASLLLSTILQNILLQQGLSSIQNNFNSFCKELEVLLKKDLNKLFQSQPQINSDKKADLIKKYSDLKSIYPQEFIQKKETLTDLIKSYLLKQNKGLFFVFVGLQVFIIYGIIASSIYVKGQVDKLMRKANLKCLKVKLRDNLALRLTQINQNFDQQTQFQFMEDIVLNTCQISEQKQMEIREETGKYFNMFILFFLFNNMKSTITNLQEQNIQNSKNNSLFNYAFELYKKYDGVKKINFNDIFKIKFKNCKQNSSKIFKLEDDKLTVFDEDLKKSIASFGMEEHIDLISALIVLRNIDCFFIIEIIRQTHFNESVKDISHQMLIKEDQMITKFFEFQSSLIQQFDLIQ